MLLWQTKELGRRNSGFERLDGIFLPFSGPKPLEKLECLTG